MTTEDKMLLYADKRNERQEKFFNWLRNIITLASGLVAILISLKHDKSTSREQHVLFISTIVLFVSGILCGCTLLFYEITFLDRLNREFSEHIQEELRSGKESDLIAYAKPDKFYGILLFVCVSCLILAMLSLSAYAIIIDI